MSGRGCRVARYEKCVGDEKIAAVRDLRVKILHPASPDWAEGATSALIVAQDWIFAGGLGADHAADLDQ
jgi:hypothetical protein